MMSRLPQKEGRARPAIVRVLCSGTENLGIIQDKKIRKMVVKVVKGSLGS